MKIYLASLTNLYEMLSFIRQEACARGFSNTQLAEIELAAEEALVNIISYAYAKHIGTIEVLCRSLHDTPGMEIEIQDLGIPYNPLLNVKNESCTPLSLEERPVGGYGVLFIVKLMDKVSYLRQDNKNILLLTKYLQN